MNTDIQVLFFDLGDTLVYIKKEIIDKICNLIKTTTEKSVDFDTYMAAFAKEWKNRTKPLDNELIKEVANEEDEKKYWEGFLEALLLSLDIASPPKILLGWMAKIYMNPKSYACFDDVKPMLDKLIAAGYRLGLISNAFPSSQKVVAGAGLGKYFDWLIFSFELSYVKPEPEIYRFALEKAGIQPNSAMFIDDRWVFVKAAREQGMRAILIERFEANKTTNKTSSLVEKITSLNELEGMVLNHSFFHKTNQNQQDKPYTKSYSGCLLMAV
jgi:putative hydrolase of the HAD superfamily